MSKEVKAAICLFIYLAAFVVGILTWALHLPRFIIIFIVFIGLSAFVYFYTQLIVPGMNFFGNPESLYNNATIISRSGTPIISVRCDGAFLLTRTTGNIPTLKVTLYTEGVIIKPLFMNAFGFYYHEISKVECIKKSIIGLGIYHFSSKVINPVVLYIGENSDIVQELIKRIGKR